MYHAPYYMHAPTQGMLAMSAPDFPRGRRRLAARTDRSESPLVLGKNAVLRARSLSRRLCERKAARKTARLVSARKSPHRLATARWCGVGGGSVVFTCSVEEIMSTPRKRTLIFSLLTVLLLLLCLKVGVSLWHEVAREPPPIPPLTGFGGFNKTRGDVPPTCCH